MHDAGEHTEAFHASHLMMSALSKVKSFKKVGRFGILWGLLGKPEHSLRRGHETARRSRQGQPCVSDVESYSHRSHLFQVQDRS